MTKSGDRANHFRPPAGRQRNSKTTEQDRLRVKGMNQVRLMFCKYANQSNQGPQVPKRRNATAIKSDGLKLHAQRFDVA